MSCPLKNTSNKNGPQLRSAYDLMMMENYSPRGAVTGYYANAPPRDTPPHHAAPWPMNRTNFDETIQQNWCPNCRFVKEQYCGSCALPEMREPFCNANTQMAMEDPNNSASYHLCDHLCNHK